jgi:alpha-L-rhamnosidase
MQIGDLNVWFYEYLAGIRTDPDRPGFQRIVIRPYPVGNLSFVRASHDSMHGRIASHWRRSGGRIELEVTIPPNTSATVWVPSKSPAGVSESGRPATEARGVKFLRAESGAAVFAVESGNYRFASE